jgi:hypothetical protein
MGHIGNVVRLALALSPPLPELELMGPGSAACAHTQVSHVRHLAPWYATVLVALWLSFKYSVSQHRAIYPVHQYNPGMA